MNNEMAKTQTWRASQAKHHAKNVPGYSVHVIDSLTVPVAEEALIAGHR